MPIPDDLERLVARRQAVAFVGAGFSKAAGMPDWLGLLGSLSSLCRTRAPATDPGAQALLTLLDVAIDSARLDDAASLVHELLTPVDVTMAVREAFSLRKLERLVPVEKERVDRRLKCLTHANFAGIITTNYDSLIEDAVSHDPEVGTFGSVVGPSDALGLSLAVPMREAFIVKLHGDTHGVPAVLSAQDYDTAYLTHSSTRLFLQTVMLRYAVVFLGCSLEDRIMQIRRDLWVTFHGNIPQCFALMANSPDNRLKAHTLRRTAGVSVLLYDLVGGDNPHQGFDNWLCELESIGDESFQDYGAMIGMLSGSVDRSNILSILGEVDSWIVAQLHSRFPKGCTYDEFLDDDLLASIAREFGRPMHADEVMYRMFFLRTLGVVRQDTVMSQIVLSVATI